MADVNVVETHALSKDEAKARVVKFEDQLAKYHMKAKWNGNEAELKGTGASGSIVVTDKDVKVNVKLGMLARAAGIDAARVESAVKKRLRAALDGEEIA